ncbi:alpha/beta hydrolase family protein [Saccharothrix variisporea]|uniref:Putative dienelactone hydrolase n=1 Tax=Saccharothrix variisporea TaxID=543527 RepID=A0A495X7G4_9PSEU|nr:alpha/beta hydrolase [Saccharothrix variisporea]RKT67458.1 putative dienelactone hydrolase [Saccharothrix variisporea]
MRKIAAGLTAAALVGVAVPATAAGNPYERGPAPTKQSVEAPQGPFATATAAVSAAQAGGKFGGGTIYYPTSTAEGTFGAVAISPGFLGTQGTIAWFGPRLASQGFVVITIDTNAVFDLPDARGDELLAALDYLTTSSAVKDRIDPARLAVMGHSMGGGGTLEAAKDRPTLQAAIPLAGWDLNTNFSGNQVPTLVVGAQSDFIAPVGQHSEPFYTSLPATLDKAYLEIRNADHFVVNFPNTTIAKYSIAWLKRFVDDDTRYDQFLCPAPIPDATISEYRDTCPH